MLNATRSYHSPNITFFLPTGPMVNATMAATLTAVQKGRSLGLNVHWVDMRRTCVGLVHQTHDDAQSFCDATKTCSYCDGCAGHPGPQGHFNSACSEASCISASPPTTVECKFCDIATNLNCIGVVSVRGSCAYNEQSDGVGWVAEDAKLVWQSQSTAAYGPVLAARAPRTLLI